MLVRCPKCQTGFNLPAERVPDGGAKLKCSACTHKFRVRVGKDEKPIYFYKKGEQPPPGWEPEEEEVEEDEDNEKTQFGFNARSKSAEEGYNPFPLAAGAASQDEDDDDPEDKANPSNRTQVLKAVTPSAFMMADDSEDANRTKLGKATSDSAATPPPPPPISADEGGKTSLGAVARASGPPRVPKGADASGDRTQALGSDLNLFEGEDISDDPQGSAPLEMGFDPFGDAFEAPVDGDVGLIMPSTPSMMNESSGLSGTSSAPGLEEPSNVSMSEESLFLGGQPSEFGPAESLVDPSFGDDVPGFDPSAGVVGGKTEPKKKSNGNGKQKKRKRRTSGQYSIGDAEDIELADVRTDERPRKPAARPQERRPAREEPAGSERAPAKKKIAANYGGQVGAADPLRSAFDVFFIVLVVLNLFLGFVAFRAGGFIDFSNFFPHMLEVAFEGKDYQPREEWQQVVEVDPPAPPPEEPLRFRDVRAVEQEVGDKRVVAIFGKLQNYSLQTFQGVKLRAEIVDPNDKIISAQTQAAGRALDLGKLKKAKNDKDVAAVIEEKIPDIGKEGRIQFAFVFDDIPAELVDSGEYSYRVALTE